MENYWTALGKQRRLEGFSMSEIMVAICLIRRDACHKESATKACSTRPRISTSHGTLRKDHNFFERPEYFTVRGFEEKT